MSGWCPIETAPTEDGALADLWCVHPEHQAQRSADMEWDGIRHRWRDGMGMPLNPGWRPTQWMPLPAPPAER